MQDIAAAGHARGIVLMKGDTVVGSVEAAELCKALRAAHENTRGEEGKHDHVERLAFGIATRLGVKGHVQVAGFAWRLIQGYARAIRTRGQAAGAAADAPAQARERSPGSLHGSNDARRGNTR